MNQGKRQCLIFILTVLSYWMVGRLALMMAVPPGYAVGIWPPAGIALAVLLMFGRRHWPAVLLGSFLTNSAGISLDQPLWSVAQAAGVPLLIGIGSALQALFGASLLRRYVGYPMRLDDMPSVLWFLLVGCGVSCLVSASVGVSALIISGALVPENALFNWFTWWAGDCLGVMIFSVILFVLFARPREIWQSRKQTLLPILLLTCSVIVILFIQASRWEVNRQRAQFDRLSETLQQKLESELSRYVDGLHSVQGLFESSLFVSPEDFRIFTSNILSRSPGFQAIAWNRVIAASEVTEFEGTLSNIDAPARQIFKRDDGGRKIPVTEPGPYTVITYAEPLEKNRPALGYAISAMPLPRDALKRARNSGAPAATDPTRLIQETGNQRGVVMYLPVYRRIDSQSERRLLGYVAGVFRVEDLLHSVFSDRDLQGVSLQLNAILSSRMEEVLFKKSDEGSGSSLFDDQWQLQFADRQWRVDVSASQRFMASARSIMPWVLLASGMLFSGLLGMFFLIVSGQKHRSDEAGNELREMLERLNRAQKQLVESEKLASLGGMVAGFAHELNTPLGVVITAESTLNSDLAELQVSLAEADSARVQTLLERIRQASGIALANAQRAGQMISSFKTLSVDQSHEEIRQIDLCAYLDDVLTHFSPKYRHSGHSVTLDCAAGTTIRTVPGGLTQVVINILSNSLQHAFREGEKGQCSIRVYRDDSGVRLRIADNGVGMAPAIAEKIFEPFFTTRRGEGGTGLGLHLVFNIVHQQLKGRIWVTTSPGQGAAFEIWLPTSVDGRPV